jgi:hypothetical protein
MTMEEERETIVLPRTSLSYSKKPIKFGAAKSSTPPDHVVSALLLVSVILWLLLASLH